MTALAEVIDAQLCWAKRKKLKFDDKGYLPVVEDNLFRPLTRQTLKAFENGGGSELSKKMRALHSSSALAANFFDYWTDRNPLPLLRALHIDAPSASIEFEVPFRTGLGGTPPNLDVVVRTPHARVFAFESKFTEWLGPKPPSKELFSATYFPETHQRWSTAGLPASQVAAANLNSGMKKYGRLDVAQLLKHSLGLATQSPGKFELRYIYFDWAGSESQTQFDELARFQEAIGADFPFHHGTYQDLFTRLLVTAQPEHESYLEYLGDRYFTAPPSDCAVVA